MRTLLHLMVDLRELLLDNFCNPCVKRRCRQSEPCLGLGPVTGDYCASGSFNSQHRRVFGQCVNDHVGDAMISGVHAGPFKQACAVSAATGGFENRDTKFGRCLVRHLRRIGQMRHCDDRELTVVNPKHLIAVQMQTIHVLLNVFISGVVPEAQIPIVRFKA